MKKRICTLTAIAAVFLFSFSYTNARAQSALPVVVSIAPQKYMLERIAGDLLDITALVKPGADPHSYEPGPAQMRECAAAKLYFSIGVPFEDVWLPRIAGTNKDLRVVSVIRDIRRNGFSDTDTGDENTASGHAPHARHDDMRAEHGHEHDDAGHAHEHGHDGEDPHVWLSPLLVERMLPSMVEALCDALPEHASEFRNNAVAFAEELQALHKELEALFAATPEPQRVFLTFHPSWGYFAHEFGLTELSIEVDGKEPGPRAMKGIIDAAREHKLKAIFVEPQFPTAAASAVAANIKAEVKRIDPLAENLLENLRQVARELNDSFPR